jgi:branched-subunit amino acid transport protein
VFDVDPWTLLTIVLLGCITVITRGFFFISSKPWSLPHWAQRGLQYAPIAALAAVVVPEIVMSQGALITTWQDARLYAAAAGMAWFFWKRGVLGTIVCGMAVYLPLRLNILVAIAAAVAICLVIEKASPPPPGAKHV